MASLQQWLRSLTFRAAKQFQGAVKRMSLFVGSEVKRSEEDSVLSCVDSNVVCDNFFRLYTWLFAYSEKLVYSSDSGVYRAISSILVLDHIGRFQKISVPYHGRLPYFNPPCLQNFQNALSPHALGFP